MNTYSKIYDFKFKIDYDYTSGKYSSINEQIAVGGEYNFKKNFYLKFTGTKDVDTNTNIGYQYGLLYEDNCLGIDLNYESLNNIHENPKVLDTPIGFDGSVKDR